ncbi:MAG TPA: peptidoglycan editing factor PgeF [Alphaproteobacteria bacterium]|nr:peptidoglycan editing factor PgeF [Alphaproteobacteria bacterium]
MPAAFPLPEFLAADPLAAPGLRHAFFTRRGGVSEGLYAALNCGLGSNDDRGRVTENRRRAAAALGVGGERLVTAYQIHSPDVVEVTTPWAPGEAPKADALVTRTPGIALGVLSADCAPLLFADAEARVVGAAHAGWKGAFGGVAERTIEAMERLGARRDRIAAAIGPCIARASYEVGPEFAARFTDSDPATARFFEPRPGSDRLHFDLPAYLLSRLAAAGIAAIALGRDTCAEADTFFSYRRSVLNGEPDYARGLSAIVIEG